MVPSSAWRWLDWLSETASYGLVESYVTENSFENSLRPPLKLFPTHQTTSPLPQFTYYVELNCSSFDWPWDEMVMFRHQIEQKPHFFFFLNNRNSHCPLGGGIYTMQSETTEESTSPCSLTGATHILSSVVERIQACVCRFEQNIREAWGKRSEGDHIPYV